MPTQKCLQRNFPGPPTVDGKEVLQWLFLAASFLKLGLLTTWQAEGPHREPGWTTANPEGKCHRPDSSVGIWQCRGSVRTIRDVVSLCLFLGSENRQRSQLKSCHPMWQRLCRTIPDIYGYADSEDTAPHGWERGDHILTSDAGR